MSQKRNARLRQLSNQVYQKNESAIERAAYQKTSEPFYFPIENFLAFLEDLYGSNNSCSIIIKFISDVYFLLDDMCSKYPTLEDKSMKNTYQKYLLLVCPEMLKNILTLE